jgi:hypothetical protein
VDTLYLLHPLENLSVFLEAVDGKGAALVIAETAEGKICGGYNPKGFTSLGGARPSVAAFLFFDRASGKYQKLQNVEEDCMCPR